jgi:hypothetical protein
VLVRSLTPLCGVFCWSRTPLPVSGYGRLTLSAMKGRIRTSISRYEVAKVVLACIARRESRSKLRSSNSKARDKREFLRGEVEGL